MTRRRAPSDADAAAWARQLAAFLSAGVPLLRALEVLSRSGPSALRRASSGLLMRVMAGRPVWESMDGAADVWPHVLRRLVKAGEASGTLDKSLGRAAQLLEARARLRKRIVASATYPSIVLATLLLSGSIIVFVALPAFESLFAAAGAQLPLPTRVLLALAAALRKLVPFAGAGLAAGVGVFVAAPKHRRVLWDAAWRAPWVGSIVRMAAAAEVWKTFATAYGAGIVTLEALQLAEESASVPHAAQALRRIRETVLRGSRLGDSVQRESAVFPELLVTCAAVGDESGRLEEMIDKACEQLEYEAHRIAEQLAQLVEPALLLVGGVLAALLAIGLYLPVLNVASVVGR